VTPKLSPTSPSGAVGGPLILWGVPLVELVDSQLRFDNNHGTFNGLYLPTENGLVKQSRTSVDLLGMFVHLQAAQDKTIHRFATKYGPLSIKLNHPGMREQMRAAAQGIKLRHLPNGFGTETLEMWRNFAHDLSVLAATHEGFERYEALRAIQLLPKESIGGVQMIGFKISNSGPFQRPEDGTSEVHCKPSDFIESFLSWWLDQSPTSVRFFKGRLQLAPANLNAALAIQFAQMLTANHGLATCDGCAEMFQPSRQPIDGKLSWCPSCTREGRPAKHRQRQRRQRLQSEGTAND
jgi:hypothetical protein